MTSSSSHIKVEQRAYIKIRALLGYTTNSICQDLVQVYSMKVYTILSAVRRWAQRFNAGWESVEDDPRSGAPVTAATKIISLPLRN